MTAAIIGPRRPAHIDLMVKALDVTLSAEDIRRIGALFPLAR
jgi:aryl-alcohol dehydrogenase-like predicted oxidoreductase